MYNLLKTIISFNGVPTKSSTMKKIFFTIAAAAIAGSVMAGGLVTNTNQSAYYTRFIALQATTGVDAVYYNPAGLTKLSDGFHFSINNQVINQTKTITNDFVLLTDKPSTYEGIVKAPIFPGVYAVYKKGNLAFSAGFNPIGGGGGAEYATGLPSFEMLISQLVPGLATQLAPLDAGVVDAGYPDPTFRNVTGYSGDIFFEGSSIYFGYQANISYAINEMLSVAAGARFVSAKNTYQGSISGVEITAVPAAYTGISPYAGSPGDYLRAIAGTPVGASQAAMLNATAAGLDAQTDVKADVTEEGTGFTPIISINFTPIEMLNVAVKYEFATKLHLETTVFDGNDAAGMFVDGATKVADMPAQLSVGASLTPLSKLTVAAGINYFFDKNNDYDGSLDDDINMIDNNFLEYSVGVEYALNRMFRISAGFNGTSTGVNDAYQGSMRYSLNTTSFAGGLGISLTPMIDVNIGGMYTMYEDGGKSFPNSEIPVLSYNETYDTTTWLIGAGVNLHF